MREELEPLPVRDALPGLRRLPPEARSAGGEDRRLHIGEVSACRSARPRLVRGLPEKLTPKQNEIAGASSRRSRAAGLPQRCRARLSDPVAQSSGTLSGGESQRIRLASQIGSGLTGVLYVLDEPSIGLHQRDNDRLLETLKRLRDLGNTVLVVEHDEDAIRTADHVVDMGPGAGVHGGQIIAQGTPARSWPTRKPHRRVSDRRRARSPSRQAPPQGQRASG
jgi:excinuclease ABC subunit A